MVLVVQNDPHVPAGLVEEALRRASAPFKILEAFFGERVAPGGSFDALIVLGGKMSVGDLTEFPFLDYVKGLIADAVERDTPYLGICLGGQMLAEMAGGSVHRRACGERGFHPISLTGPGREDPVFGRLSDVFLSFEWHEDSFTPPEGAIHLAGTNICRFQAFRWGRSAYGLQFHPEVTASIVASWSGERNGPGAFLSAYNRLEEEYKTVSLELLESFLDFAGIG